MFITKLKHPNITHARHFFSVSFARPLTSSSNFYRLQVRQFSNKNEGPLKVPEEETLANLKRRLQQDFANTPKAGDDDLLSAA